jgi:hypothetical protein
MALTVIEVDRPETTSDATREALRKLSDWLT